MLGSYRIPGWILGVAFQVWVWVWVLSRIHRALRVKTKSICEDYDINISFCARAPEANSKLVVRKSSRPNTINDNTKLQSTSDCEIRKTIMMVRIVCTNEQQSL